MNNSMHIQYPGSEKIYIPGQIYPQIRVGMRRVKLTPTVTKDQNGLRHYSENAPVVLYDTSGAYSDPNSDIDLKRGLPRIRAGWGAERKDIEQLSEFSSAY